MIIRRNSKKFNDIIQSTPRISKKFKEPQVLLQNSKNFNDIHITPRLSKKFEELQELQAFRRNFKKFQRNS